MYVCMYVCMKACVCFRKLFCTLLRFSECILPTFHNNINIYIYRPM